MIEVGKYVRTIGGYIIKYKNKNENIFNCDNKQYIESSLFPDEEQIVKHSKELIDLIEVGDIVDKEWVIGIIDITNDKEKIIGRKLITQYRSAQFTGLDIKHYKYANDIKTILTKEIYIANCYKVGGEENERI